MELFIEAVRNYPCLWNTNHKDYRHGEKKEMAWNNIVQLNIPEITDIKTAKAEWKKLRDNHRDSLKRQRSGKTGQAADSVNNWKYAQLMEFLIPYMQNRKRSTNLTNSESTQYTNTQNIDTNTQDTQDTNTQDTNTQCTESSREQPGRRSTQNVHVDDDSSLEAGTSGLPQAKRKRNKDDDNIVDIIRELEDNHARRQEQRDMRRFQETKHPIELFFQSMAETTKKMPTYMQNNIKRKVKHINSNAEEELETFNLTKSITPSYGYSTSSATSASEQQQNPYQSPPAAAVYEQLP